MCKTIKHKVKFSASTRDVFRCLTDSKAQSALTRHKATISKKVGGRFSVYNDHIQGIVVDLLPHKRVVLAWRTVKFPVGIFSMASLTLVPTKNGGTELTLIHRGVPKEIIPEVERGWRKGYWDKIKTL